ncbi:Bax inhibitor-1/YccA family protein [Corynebacterium qintianiae]|uniref:Bax inhibitor-1/YccA family protein n=1 Tax=Corynebacterium qintianiae TaxID=2709392 RepID=A0A7T0PGJ1_9CORY|nr:Bax inhibitor-1/YccA family protein [Corynebacterium qintianiae]QPK83897.1 Bax inhibitor-1/YccA family protein [Corynebacterium qintianiae]
MKSNNPVLTQLPQAGGGAGYGYQQSYPQPYSPVHSDADRPMTVDDVVTKTGITLAVIVAFAVANFGIALAGRPDLAVILTFVGAIGGFITVLVHAFGKKFGSRTVTLIYAAFEGLFAGGFSLILSGWMVGGADAGAMIFQAILGTVGVFMGMLFVYKTGAVRVTPRFNRILTGAIVGVAVMALGNLLLFLFTGMSPLRDGGPLAIIFGVVCVVLAALSFLQDFDLADRLVRTGAPAKMAWGVALGLAVTLVWLYTEILRLLSYFNRN